MTAMKNYLSFRLEDWVPDSVRGMALDIRKTNDTILSCYGGVRRTYVHPLVLDRSTFTFVFRRRK